MDVNAGACFVHPMADNGEAATPVDECRYHGTVNAASSVDVDRRNNELSPNKAFRGFFDRDVAQQKAINWIILYLILGNLPSVVKDGAGSICGHFEAIVVM